jgi:DNA topoisomerase-1
LLRVRDRRIAKIIKACQELPGQELIQYVDEEGNCRDVTSTDVNDYLREITAKDITAKDFRTWAGTVLAAMGLRELESFDSAAQAKRNLRAAIEKVSARLGNTPTICRKCYVHPEVLNSYMDGNLVLELKSKAESELRSDLERLTPEEAAVLAYCLAGSRKRRRVRKRSGCAPLDYPCWPNLFAALQETHCAVLDRLHRFWDPFARRLHDDIQVAVFCKGRRFDGDSAWRRSLTLDGAALCKTRRANATG